jgi:hypothetical protein
MEAKGVKPSRRGTNILNQKTRQNNWLGTEHIQLKRLGLRNIWGKGQEAVKDMQNDK